MALRSPICVMLGHVDHGKTSILDKIRGTAIAAKEAGGITQNIGASVIPISTIKEICKGLLLQLKMEITMPGILFVDSPGHAAFQNLRKRGGNLADIAILVVDINEGFKPQTVECVEILKHYKTPFLIAANKVDLIPGWKSKEGSLLSSISQQDKNVAALLETRMYEIVGKLFGASQISAERFDRVQDFTKTIAIIPVSARTGEGLPELLMMLTGLAQKFMEKSLEVKKGNAKGTILEVKEEKGLGKVVDVILYDGSLAVNDTIVIGSMENPIVTKVRGLFEPMPKAEMRDRKAKFKSVKEVNAACGVRVSAPMLEEAVSGMPIASGNQEEIEKVKEEVQKEVEEVIIDTDENGMVAKADSLGSLEALTALLREKGFAISKASIGNVTKKDISDALSNYEKDPLTSVIIGFNVKSDVEAGKVKVILNEIIYKLIDELTAWQAEEIKKQEAGKLDLLVRPCKIQIMKGYVFRQSNPAVCGVDVLSGVLRVGTKLMKESGDAVGEVKSIQHEQENLSSAEKGKQVAISLPGVTIGRTVHEGDILLSAIPEDDFRKMKELRKHLKEEEVEILKEIAKIHRKENPVWGI
ncbi:MAG TPA: translation initiation factor IF-2 [Candidatus Nanoarchaeia archaeon]|nr:translation initiation factor IF-2 [Candidatus Nanoarchaeia archaeon]